MAAADRSRRKGREQRSWRRCETALREGGPVPKTKKKKRAGSRPRRKVARQERGEGRGALRQGQSPSNDGKMVSCGTNTGGHAKREQKVDHSRRIHVISSAPLASQRRGCRTGLCEKKYIVTRHRGAETRTHSRRRRGEPQQDKTRGQGRHRTTAREKEHTYQVDLATPPASQAFKTGREYVRGTHGDHGAASIGRRRGRHRRQRRETVIASRRAGGVERCRALARVVDVQVPTSRASTTCHEPRPALSA